ncbi:retrovirus-related Pol polyprotein from transposon 17.6 [Trichonephila clavipes]|nr:retrovirus-related Pol polyprotein from transposon 17.6 [Trichonephila clavipes]
MVIDTGANVSIIRKKIGSKLTSIIWTPPCISLQTVTGDTIQVHGKTNITLRFCVDYRLLNDVTKKDSYPVQWIDDTLDTLAGNTWFSTLDLKSGYWKVELHPDDKEKTAFTTGKRLWQFKVMPFGLCNAPATFERLMETVLGGLSYEACLVYLDDIIVVGSSFEEHLKNIRRVLQKLKVAHLKLSPSKCHLFQREVTYLEHIILAKGVRTDAYKISAVKNWNCPTDVYQLRSFFGLCTHYRKFMKNFSTIARALHKLTETKQNFIWTGDCNNAFNKLKDAITSAPVLTYPEIEKQFILHTNASHESVGAVLSQEMDGEERIIVYFSKCLSKPEINDCVTRTEMLAVLNAVEHTFTLTSTVDGSCCEQIMPH